MINYVVINLERVLFFNSSTHPSKLTDTTIGWQATHSFEPGRSIVIELSPLIESEFLLRDELSVFRIIVFDPELFKVIVHYWGTITQIKRKLESVFGVAIVFTSDEYKFYED